MPGLPVSLPLRDQTILGRCTFLFWFLLLFLNFRDCLAFSMIYKCKCWFTEAGKGQVLLPALFSLILLRTFWAMLQGRVDMDILNNPSGFFESIPRCFIAWPNFLNQSLLSKIIQLCKTWNEFLIPIFFFPYFWFRSFFVVFHNCCVFLCGCFWVFNSLIDPYPCPKEEEKSLERFVPASNHIKVK